MEIAGWVYSWVEVVVKFPIAQEGAIINIATTKPSYVR